MAEISIPPGYEELIPPPNPITSLEQSQAAPLEGGLVMGRPYQNITSVPISPENLARKYEGTTYTNGITFSQNTFFNTVSYSDFIPFQEGLDLNYSVTGIGPSFPMLGGSPDFAISKVKAINNIPSAYDDFIYNTLSNTKIFLSFSSRIKYLLEIMYTAGGLPLKDLIVSSFRKSLVFGEEENFSEKDFKKISGAFRNVTPLDKSTNQAVNNTRVINSIINDSYSLDPDEYDIKIKNKMVNWKSLSEDLNKRVVYRTSDGTESTIYIPNADTITITLADGTLTSMSMQDGDYFVANPIKGTDRLTVFSDVSMAKTLNAIDIAKNCELITDPYEIIGECESSDTDLVEFNVDLDTNRQDYYFLKPVMSSIKDEPSKNLLQRKTSATYEYITTGIDDIIKHRAFPYFVAYLRYDDMLFNQLEVAKSMKFTFTDLTIDKLTNESQFLLPRKFPWSIVLIPSNETSKVITHQRSFLESFKKRKIRFTMSPALTELEEGVRSPFYLSEVLTTEDSINFDTDMERTVEYQEGLKYELNTTELDNLDKYKNGIEPLPREMMPTSRILNEINTIKNTYSLKDRDNIPMYNLLTRIEPKYFQSLFWDQQDVNDFKTTLYFNNVTDDSVINKTYFLPIKEVAKVDLVSPKLLDDSVIPPTFTKSPTTGVKVVGDPQERTTAPQVF